MLVIFMAVGLLHYLVARHRDQVSLAQADELPQRRNPCFQFPKAFLIFWLPWLMFLLGNMGVSLLRDHGFQIFPWPILANCLQFSLWFNLAQRWRARHASCTDTAA